MPGKGATARWPGLGAHLVALSHSHGDRRTLCSSCDSPTRGAPAWVGCAGAVGV